MKYYSFNLRVSYNDEFDVDTFFIVNEKGLEHIKKIVNDAANNSYSDVYFGGYYPVDAGDIIESFSSEIPIKELTKDEVECVLKAFDRDDVSVEMDTDDGILFTHGPLFDAFEQLENSIDFIEDDDD